jgi:hypothetical protein
MSTSYCVQGIVVLCLLALGVVCLLRKCPQLQLKPLVSCALNIFSFIGNMLFLRYLNSLRDASNVNSLSSCTPSSHFLVKPALAMLLVGLVCLFSTLIFGYAVATRLFSKSELYEYDTKNALNSIHLKEDTRLVAHFVDYKVSQIPCNINFI